jgi:hypothetical protein
VRDSNPRPPACKAGTGGFGRFHVLRPVSRNASVHTGLRWLAEVCARCARKRVCARFLSRPLAATSGGRVHREESERALCPPSDSRLLRPEPRRAVAGRLAHQSRCAGRNELDHDIHERDAAFVPDDVRAAPWFEELRPGRKYARRTRGVVSLVEGRGSGLDGHKARLGVAVPAESPARLNRDLYYMEVRQSRRLELCLPVAALGFGIDLQWTLTYCPLTSEGSGLECKPAPVPPRSRALRQPKRLQEALDDVAADLPPEAPSL